MNRVVSYWSRIVVVSLSAVGVAASDDEKPPFAGLWNGVVVVGDVEVPFRFEIDGSGAAVKGSFFNGNLRITSTGGHTRGAELTLSFDQYATKLVATLHNGQLTGEYRRPRGPYPFRATRAAQPVVASRDAPSIDGVWIVTAKGSKGEAAWRLISRQKGSEVTATILRVDGDTGTLEGGWRDGRFVLSHFSGARPLLLEITPAADGTLVLKQNNKSELIAARENTAQALAIGVPSDPSGHTAVKDPAEPLRFQFPDLSGRTVSNADERFEGKVVLVNISGSWCPNCHDEAPFLVSLDRKYRAQGLEVVTLSFEEADQLKDPSRLRAFIKTYGIGYTVLLAGEPSQLSEMLPQAKNLDAFPTTFIVGRDGRVRSVHAGFPSPGSGAYYEKAEKELTQMVERLLAENF
jgi:peroxiredoxin